MNHLEALPIVLALTSVKGLHEPIGLPGHCGVQTESIEIPRAKVRNCVPLRSSAAGLITMYRCIGIATKASQQPDGVRSALIKQNIQQNGIAIIEIHKIKIIIQVQI